MPLSVETPSGATSLVFFVAMGNVLDPSDDQPRATHARAVKTGTGYRSGPAIAPEKRRRSTDGAESAPDASRTASPTRLPEYACMIPAPIPPEVLTPFVPSSEDSGLETSQPASRDHARCCGCSSGVRATACKAPRHCWHLRQSWHCGICNLQNLKGPVGFESHPLRQLELL